MANEELFGAVRQLVAKLDAYGHGEAAKELKTGFACLNGLTDGWALFLESIRKVEATHAKRLAPTERNALKSIRSAVHRAVYRH